MASMPTTVERVPQHTAPEINARIREEATREVAVYSKADTDMIDRRIAELDAEWTSERVLETNASILILTGTLMAVMRKRWLIVPAVVGGFLLQHALQGWCPPLAVIRRLGYRTEHEVDAERAALLRARAHPDEKDDAEALLRQAGWTT